MWVLLSRRANRGDEDTEKEAKKDDEIERGCDTEKETEKEVERWTSHRFGIRNREINHVLKLSDFIERQMHRNRETKIERDIDIVRCTGIEIEEENASLFLSLRLEFIRPFAHKQCLWWVLFFLWFFLGELDLLYAFNFFNSILDLDSKIKAKEIRF